MTRPVVIHRDRTFEFAGRRYRISQGSTRGTREWDGYSIVAVLSDLGDAYERISGRMEALRLRWQSRHGRLSGILEAHRIVATALRDGAIDRAALALERHIRGTAEAYATIARESEPTSQGAST